ncbi:uncharacterized protein [Montipora capricornis]|uniref:uncharacterized protein n=1 Tax=Montipora capricornis TaxID=246305 RepID=UPI0035F100F2
MKKEYLKPENCPMLEAPKVNTMLWGQLKQEPKMSSLYALLKVCNQLIDKADSKEMLTMLTHAVVLSLSANRQLNLSRRELLRPHLNKNYQALCNPAVPITTNLFGDDLNKQVDDLTKANKIGLKVQGSGKQRFHPYGRGSRARGRYRQNYGGRGRSSTATEGRGSFLDQEKVIIDAQVAEFLSKGILSYSESQDDQIISPIFLRPTPDGTYRVIFNLKALNESVVYHHFKLDTLEATLPLITPGCYMTSLDLKDAYYLIPIAPEHQRFLKFIWKGVLYQFRCLPMGLTSSPRIFTKALKPVFAYLRGQCGISCAGYIDDSLYLGDTYETCLMNTLTAVQLFISLGFQVHPKKSMVVPTQKIEYLGFVVSYIDMTVRLTEEKVSAIIKRCRDFSRVNKEHSIREVASLVGTLISTFAGVQYGPLHYRSPDRDKMDALKRCKGDYEAYMVLSPESLGELSWWITHVDSSHVSGHATLFQSNQKNIDESFIGRTTTPPPGHPTGMQSVRQSLVEHGISPQVANVIMSSWRSSIVKQYDVFLDKWSTFCLSRQNSFMRAPVSLVLDFLHDLYDKGYSYSSLNTARSAISALCTADNTDVSQNIGKHPLICRFLKGVFNEIPPIPKFQEVWPVEQVLDYLEQLTPLHSLKLKDLTMKLVMLIALVTGQRCQTLSYLDISGEHMKKFPTYFSFSLSGHLKQDKPGRVFGNVRLFQYPKETLCVYTTLERYIEVTQSLRKSSKLLISYIKPHNEVSSSTIGRWLKTCLSLANIDVNIYQAHSTRSASTTKAAQLLPIDVVMKLAGWSQESTFRKYYDKPGAITDQMSNAVLSTVEK